MQYKKLFFIVILLCFGVSSLFAVNNKNSAKNKKDSKVNQKVFKWEKAPDGSKKLIYHWDQKAIIFALDVKKGDNIYPGEKIMTLSIEGRSKAHLKVGESMKVLNLGKINGELLKPAKRISKGQVLLRVKPEGLFQDSVATSAHHSKSLPGWGKLMHKLWGSTGVSDIIRESSEYFPGTWQLGLGRIIMIFVGLILVSLAIFKGFEPLLLVPIGFGAVLSNIPLAGISGPDGILGMIYAVGIQTGVFPLLIFMGVGAMTDFGPLIAHPKTAILGASAQFGIFFALIGALLLNYVGINFTLPDAASIGIIGGADGPTAIFLTSQLSPRLLGPIAVAAYSYMALVPIIQPPIMNLLTTKEDRQIKMQQLREVSKLEKIVFPVVITLICALLLPDAAPLIGMLMFGNLMRECGVVERLNSTAQNALMNSVTIFLGLAVGSKLSADKFLSMQTIGILVLGMLAFCVGTTVGVSFGQLMKKLTKGKINPLIGGAGVSAVPMASRVVNKVGLDNDQHNFLLMHAMGPNVAGVIGSAVVAGVMLSFFS